MHGLIPKTFLSFVLEVGGEDAAEKVRAGGGVAPDENFRLDRVLPEEKWLGMFRSGLEALRVSEAEGEEAFARYFLADGLRRWPAWFSMAGDSRHFLESVPKIHNSLAGGVMETEDRKRSADKFRIESINDRELVTHYRSPNRHCGLFEALARLVLQHYGDEADVFQDKCM